jgi:hypothetical protein
MMRRLGSDLHFPSEIRIKERERESKYIVKSPHILFMTNLIIYAKDKLD